MLFDTIFSLYTYVYNKNRSTFLFINYTRKLEINTGCLIEINVLIYEPSYKVHLFDN